MGILGFSVGELAVYTVCMYSGVVFSFRLIPSLLLLLEEGVFQFSVWSCVLFVSMCCVWGLPTVCMVFRI